MVLLSSSIYYRNRDTNDLTDIQSRLFTVSYVIEIFVTSQRQIRLVSTEDHCYNWTKQIWRSEITKNSITL